MGAQEEIRISEERLNAIFLTCQIGIAFFNLEDRFIQVNSAMTTLLSIMGTLNLIWYSSMDDPNFSESVKEKIKNRETFSTEIAYGVPFVRYAETLK